MISEDLRIAIAGDQSVSWDVAGKHLRVSAALSAGGWSDRIVGWGITKKSAQFVSIRSLS